MIATMTFLPAPEQGKECVGSSTLPSYLYSTDGVLKTGELEGHQAFGSCSLRFTLPLYSQSVATYTAEFNSEVKTFSLKIDLILFKLEMYCVSLSKNKSRVILLTN